MFAVDSLSDVVDKLAICHNLFLFVTFFFCVIVHVAKQIVFFLFLCMDELRQVNRDLGSVN